MEDLVAAVVFIAALSALFVFATLVIRPFLPAKIAEVPTAPGQDVPTRRIYIYNASGRLYAVEYAGSDVETFTKAVGVAGTLVAIFETYPGGYRCISYTSRPVRIGDEPYTGLWCPPPFDDKVGQDCMPTGVTSRGRWLLIQYRCPGLS